MTIVDRRGSGLGGRDRLWSLSGRAGLIGPAWAGGLFRAAERGRVCSSRYRERFPRGERAWIMRAIKCLKGIRWMPWR